MTYFTDDDYVEIDGEPCLTRTGVAKLKRLADELAVETKRVDAAQPGRTLQMRASQIWARWNGKTTPTPVASPVRQHRLNAGDGVEATRDALNALATRIWARRDGAS